MSSQQAVAIFGYGSLMDELSARKTMPSATNFRRGALPHHCRVYSLVSIGGLKSGRASLATREVAALAARPQQGCSIRGVLFDISQDEFAAYLEREHRYRVEEHSVVQLWGGGEGDDVVRAFTCLEQTDEQYLTSLAGGMQEWQERVGQFYPSSGPGREGGQGGRLWGRHDVLPMTTYMADVVVAASTLGEEWLRHAVDNTFLTDGVTSLRAYVQGRLAQEQEGGLRRELATRRLGLPREKGEDEGGAGDLTVLEYMLQLQA